jgi:hypothetical protein
MSRIYINELDISKIKVGQKANIVVDAFPKKSFGGLVASIANIGDKLPNTDTKVFEVLIKINGYNPLLRPLMTTGNKIIINTFKDVIQIPIECLQANEERIPYVYTENRTNQVVITGESNEKYVIIEKGLEPGTNIYLTTPEKPEKFRLAGDDLISVIREREIARKAENGKQMTQEGNSEEVQTYSGGSYFEETK